MKNEQIETFSAKELKRLREDYGLSQRKLGKLVGLSDLTILNYEKDKHPMPERAQRMFIRLFDELEKDIQLGELIREWDREVQKTVYEGIRLGRIQKGTDARSLPSMRNVVWLLDRLRNL